MSAPPRQSRHINETTYIEHDPVDTYADIMITASELLGEQPVFFKCLTTITSLEDVKKTTCS